MQFAIPLPLTLVAVVAFSVITTAVARRYAHGRLAPSGVEFLLVGVAVGPLGIDLLSRSVISSLDSVLSLVLGLAGFALGLTLRRRLTSRQAIAAGALGAVLTAALVGAAVVGLLSLQPVPDALFEQRIWLGLTLGAAAAAVSAVVIEFAAAQVGASGRATETLRAVGVASNVVAVAIAGASLAARRSHLASNQLGLTETEWFVSAALLGVVCGFLFHIFLGRKTTDLDRTFLATVGVIILTSGLASALGMSPLFSCLAAGATVSLLSPVADEIEPVVERLERPAFALVCIFAGAMWQPVDGLLWVLPIAYLAVRVVALQISSRAALASQPELPPLSGLGMALVSQGAVASAIALNHAQIYPLEAPVVLVAVLTPAMVIDLLVAPARLRRFFANAGETGRERRSEP